VITARHAWLGLQEVIVEQVDGDQGDSDEEEPVFATGDVR
jgi:hypothetical protein